MTPDKGRPMRKIVAWVYRSNNSSWGYDAILECGHKRTDLSSQFAGHRGRSNYALCWVCTPESAEVLPTEIPHQEGK